MKLAFEILKGRPKIPVVLTRDSVCAGDDCDAPHEKIISIYSFSDPKAFAKDISSGYLPSIAGIGHSWICVLNDIKIAEISSSDINPLVSEIKLGTENRAHFIYKSARY